MEFDELPAVIAGRYRPVRHLGEGGMGTVFVVEHLHTGEQLALKLLLGHLDRSPQAIERFKREARAFAQIRSEHVVRVIDADLAEELGGARFLVMELLEGADLAHHARGVAQPPSEVISWMRQLARALDKAHACGIVHRDLKPENLFLTRRDDGSALLKVLDFGIARMQGAAGATESGTIIGTPRYMAPEQAKGEVDNVGPHTDVWAIGLIVYRLLSGRDYWPGDTLSMVAAQIIYAPIVPPSAQGCDLGAAFDQWFLRSCSRDIAARWASVTEQVEALAEVLQAVATPGTVAEGEAVVVDPALLPTEQGQPPSRCPAEAEAALQRPSTADRSGDPVGPLAPSSRTLGSPDAPEARKPRRLAGPLFLAGVAGLALAFGVARYRWPGEPEHTAATSSALPGVDSDPPQATAPSTPGASAGSTTWSEAPRGSETATASATSRAPASGIGAASSRGASHVAGAHTHDGGAPHSAAPEGPLDSQR